MASPELYLPLLRLVVLILLKRHLAWLATRVNEGRSVGFANRVPFLLSVSRTVSLSA